MPVISLSIILLSFWVLTLLLDLILAAARSAFDNANGARLISMGETNGPKGNRTIRQLNQIDHVRLTLDISQSLAHFLMAGLALAWLISLDKIILSWPWGVLFISGGLLFAIVLETLVSRSIARHPEGWAVRLSGITGTLLWILTPFLGSQYGPQPGQPGGDSQPGNLTEDDLMNMVDASQQEGVLEQDEREMIYSIFQFRDTLAREIMIPRIDILAVDVKTPLPEAVDQILRVGFSRLPVYEETIDNIQGLLYTKDLLRVLHENQKNSLREILRPAYFVPEAKKVDELLDEMQSQRIHMAMIVDEYGGIAGLVTLEDIVEEIVGEIRDEYDQAEELPYQRVSDNEVIFQGRVDLDEFNEVMNSQLPKDDAETIGGFIYNRIGRVPNQQEAVQVENLLLMVEQVSGRRIRKVRARWLPAPEQFQKKESSDDRQ
jgi:putative hemolysin